MTKRQYPELTESEVKKILKARGFSKKSQNSSHQQWEGSIGGQRRVVTVDGNESPFSIFILQSMIRQSGLSREEFYCSTRKTAKKLNLGVDPKLAGNATAEDDPTVES